MNKSKLKLTRRQFIETSSMASGAMIFSPENFYSFFFDVDNIIRSAVYTTTLSVKVVHSGLIHEAAFEGACRVGELEDLTTEAETMRMKRGLESITKQVNEYDFGSGIKILNPQGVYGWVAKGNPEIMLKDEELFKLNNDDPITDIYVLVGGDTLTPSYRIAEKYKKPVLVLAPVNSGYTTGALRARGYECFDAQDIDHLKDLLLVFKTRKAFQQTKILNVTNFDVAPIRIYFTINDLNFLKEKYGMDSQTVNYNEFFNEMDRMCNDKEIIKRSEKLAMELMIGAGKNNISREDIINSFYFYLTVLHFLNRYNCNAFGIECGELCSSMQTWNRRFTPCITHSLLRNEGFPSACEKDLSALLAMSVMMYLTNKPVYMGNPRYNLEKNIINLHHSGSPTKMTGFNQPAGYYELYSFTHAKFGATIRYDYNSAIGQQVTLSRFDPTGKKMLVIPGEIAGGGGMEGFYCSQNVDIAVKNIREIRRQHQNFGHHLSMVYGNCTEQIRDLSEIMDFDVVMV